MPVTGNWVAQKRYDQSLSQNTSGKVVPPPGLCWYKIERMERWSGLLFAYTALEEGIEDSRYIRLDQLGMVGVYKENCSPGAYESLLDG